MHSLTRAPALGPTNFLGSPFELVASVQIDQRALALASEWSGGTEQAKTLVLESGETNNDTLRFSWRVRWAPPGNWREDIRFSAEHIDVFLVRDDLAAVFVAGQRVLFTNRPDEFSSWPRGSAESGRYFTLPTIASRMQEVPLLFPPFPVEEWSFTELSVQPGNIEETRTIRISRRPGLKHDVEDRRSGYWLGVHEYEVAVDARSGIVRRFIGIASRAVVASIEITELSFDAHPDDDAFGFLPPAHSKIVAAGV